MSGLSYFDALGVRGVDRKPLIIAELAGKPLELRIETHQKMHKTK